MTVSQPDDRFSGGTSSDGALLAFYRLLSLLPWLWLLLLAAFALLVTLQQGQLPAYGAPDPKDTGALVVFYYGVILLTVAVVASVPVWLFLTGLSTWQRYRLQAGRAEKLAYLGGLLLFALVAVGDLGGLMTWLVD